MDREQLYRRSPIWLQNFFITLKGYDLEKNRVDKKSCLAFYHELLKSQYWTREQINDYQNIQFISILGEAFESVPYYQRMARNLQCSIHDFKGIEDIQKLPFLKKETVRGSEMDFVSTKVALKNLSKGHTSGTTGSPMKLFSTREIFSRRWAFELRLRNWATLEDVYHPRRIQFTGKEVVPPNQKSKKFWRHNIASNTLHCSTVHISDISAAYYASAISRFKPEFIDGYPSAIVSLSKICLFQNHPLPQVKAIRVSAETLSDEDREIIETAFRAKVFNQYGSSESSCFCSDNSLGEMLIHPEFGFVEILANGEVVTTCFLNPVMPLIRYQIGDLALKSDKEVHSLEGKNFQRLESVLGRMEDTLKINGNYIQRLSSIFRKVDGLVESQIMKVDEEKLAINLVKNSLFDLKSKHLILKNLRSKVGDDMKVEFKYVDKIERGPNGKFKAIIDLTKNGR